jgi:hypothetical protein
MKMHGACIEIRGLIISVKEKNKTGEDLVFR